VPKLSGIRIRWVDGTVSGRYGFLHEFYREVIYGRIPPTLRSRLHRRLGERLEAGHVGSTALVAAELAIHFERGRDYARAVRYLNQAADNAIGRFANREALGYLDRAFVLAGGFAEPEHSAAHLTLLERRGLVRRASDDLAGAAADFEALASHARRLGHAAKEIEARFCLAGAVSWSDRERCLAASDEALDHAATLDDPLLLAHARGRPTGTSSGGTGATTTHAPSPPPRWQPAGRAIARCSPNIPAASRTCFSDSQATAASLWSRFRMHSGEGGSSPDSP
jgi:hypothetical protein